MIINAKEIYDLARFAGFEITPLTDEWELETEYRVEKCPKLGILDEDDKTCYHYNLVASISDYPEEGYFGLGDGETVSFIKSKLEKWKKYEQKTD